MKKGSVILSTSLIITLLSITLCEAEIESYDGDSEKTHTLKKKCINIKKHWTKEKEERIERKRLEKNIDGCHEEGSKKPEKGCFRLRHIFCVKKSGP